MKSEVIFRKFLLSLIVFLILGLTTKLVSSYLLINYSYHVKNYLLYLNVTVNSSSNASLAIYAYNLSGDKIKLYSKSLELSNSSITLPINLFLSDNYNGTIEIFANNTDNDTTSLNFTIKKFNVNICVKTTTGKLLTGFSQLIQIYVNQTKTLKTYYLNGSSNCLTILVFNNTDIGINTSTVPSSIQGREFYAIEPTDQITVLSDEEISILYKTLQRVEVKASINGYTYQNPSLIYIYPGETINLNISFLSENGNSVINNVTVYLDNQIYKSYYNVSNIQLNLQSNNIGVHELAILANPLNNSYNETSYKLKIVVTNVWKVANSSAAYIDYTKNEISCAYIDLHGWKNNTIYILEPGVFDSEACGNDFFMLENLENVTIRGYGNLTIIKGYAYLTVNTQEKYANYESVRIINSKNVTLENLTFVPVSFSTNLDVLQYIQDSLNIYDSQDITLKHLIFLSNYSSNNQLTFDALKVVESNNVLLKNANVQNYSLVFLYNNISNVTLENIIVNRTNGFAYIDADGYLENLVIQNVSFYFPLNSWTSYFTITFSKNDLSDINNISIKNFRVYSEYKEYLGNVIQVKNTPKIIVNNNQWNNIKVFKIIAYNVSEIIVKDSRLHYGHEKFILYNVSNLTIISSYIRTIKLFVAQNLNNLAIFSSTIVIFQVQEIEDLSTVLIYKSIISEQSVELDSTYFLFQISQTTKNLNLTILNSRIESTISVFEIKDFSASKININIFGTRFERISSTISKAPLVIKISGIELGDHPTLTASIQVRILSSSFDSFYQFLDISSSFNYKSFSIDILINNSNISNFDKVVTFNAIGTTSSSGGSSNNKLLVNFVFNNNTVEKIHDVVFYIYGIRSQTDLEFIVNNSKFEKIAEFLNASTVSSEFKGFCHFVFSNLIVNQTPMSQYPVYIEYIKSPTIDFVFSNILFNIGTEIKIESSSHVYFTNIELDTLYYNEVIQVFSGIEIFHSSDIIIRNITTSKAKFNYFIDIVGSSNIVIESINLTPKNFVRGWIYCLASISRSNAIKIRDIYINFSSFVKNVESTDWCNNNRGVFNSRVYELLIIYYTSNLIINNIYANGIGHENIDYNNLDIVFAFYNYIIFLGRIRNAIISNVFLKNFVGIGLYLLYSANVQLSNISLIKNYIDHKGLVTYYYYYKPYEIYLDHSSDILIKNLQASYSEAAAIYMRDSANISILNYNLSYDGIPRKISCSGDYTSSYAVIILASNQTNFTNGIVAYSLGAYQISRSNQFLLRASELKHLNENGLDLSSDQEITIYNISIEYANIGIFANASSNISLNKIKIRQINATGIKLLFIQNCSINNSELEQYKTAIELINTSGLNISYVKAAYGYLALDIERLIGPVTLKNITLIDNYFATKLSNLEDIFKIYANWTSVQSNYYNQTVGYVLFLNPELYPVDKLIVDKNLLIEPPIEISVYAIYAWNLSLVNINNSLFQHNTMLLHVYNLTKFYLNNDSFSYSICSIKLENLNFGLINESVFFDNNYSIIVTLAKKLVINNSVFKENTLNAIQTNLIQELAIDLSKFSNNNVSIVVNSADKINFTKDIIQNNRIGLKLQKLTTSGIISFSVIKNNSIGISISNATNLIIISNNVTYNSIGALALDSVNLTFIGNQFKDNSPVGLHLIHDVGMNILNNTFYANEIGAEISGKPKLMIINRALGVAKLYLSKDAILLENVFESNKIGLKLNGTINVNISDNIFKNNVVGILARCLIVGKIFCCKYCAEPIECLNNYNISIINSTFYSNNQGIAFSQAQQDKPCSCYDPLRFVCVYSYQIAISDENKTTVFVGRWPTNLLIKGCNFTKNSEAIHLDAVYNYTLISNVFLQNTVSLKLLRAVNGTLIDNVFNNDSEYSIYRPSTYKYETENLTLVGNQFIGSNSTQSAIYIAQFIGDLALINNIFNQSFGLLIKYSLYNFAPFAYIKRIVIENNTIDNSVVFRILANGTINPAEEIFFANNNFINVQGFQISGPFSYDKEGITFNSTNQLTIVNVTFINSSLGEGFFVEGTFSNLTKVENVTAINSSGNLILRLVNCTNFYGNNIASYNLYGTSLEIDILHNQRFKLSNLNAQFCEKGMTIKANSRSGLVENVSLYSLKSEPLILMLNNTIIRRVVVTNTSNLSSKFAVLIYGSKNLTLENSMIYNNLCQGILINKSDVVINMTWIFNNTRGIYIDYSNVIGDLLNITLNHFEGLYVHKLENYTINKVLINNSYICYNWDNTSTADITNYDVSHNYLAVINSYFGGTNPDDPYSVFAVAIAYSSFEVYPDHNYFCNHTRRGLGTSAAPSPIKVTVQTTVVPFKPVVQMYVVVSYGGDIGAVSYAQQFNIIPIFPSSRIYGHGKFRIIVKNGRIYIT
jgi:hypothetical protein